MGYKVEKVSHFFPQTLHDFGPSRDQSKPNMYIPLSCMHQPPRPLWPQDKYSASIFLSGKAGNFVVLLFGLLLHHSHYCYWVGDIQKLHYQGFDLF